MGDGDVDDVEKIIDEETRGEKAARLGFSQEDVNRAVLDSNEQFFINLCDDLNAAISTYREIGSLLDEHCGLSDSPPTSNIISTLEACLGPKQSQTASSLMNATNSSTAMDLPRSCMTLLWRLLLNKQTSVSIWCPTVR